MHGNIRDILPVAISDESEKIIQETIDRKVKSAARFAVSLFRALEEHFGPETRQVLKKFVFDRQPEIRSNPGEASEDLHTFCGNMEKACIGSHRWQKLCNESDKIGYSFSRCLWAEAFREAGEPDLGFYFCAGDEPAVKAYNPGLGFRRTKVLMKGDEICDHIFLVEKPR